MTHATRSRGLRRSARRGRAQLRAAFVAAAGLGLGLGLGCGPGEVAGGDALTCGAGTEAKDGECLASDTGLACGAGTVEEDGACVPEEEVDVISCGEGTIEDDGVCVPEALPDPLECGPGTVEDDGACVPEEIPDPLECGPGTEEQEGACIPVDVISCGFGTVQIEDECVPSDELATCGPGTLEVDGECQSQTAVWVRLPRAQGTLMTVTQSAHGFLSHNGISVNAVDFIMPEGSEVTAAKGGRVLRTKEDSDTGCGDVSCAADGNFIWIDHGDGTLGIYAHFQFEGVLVEPGDQVCQGEPIGLSGNTGFSTGPHLHFEVRDFWQYSVPVRFEELADETGGVIHGGLELPSGNPVPSVCDDDTPFTDCPADLYQVRGIELDDGAPCTVAQLDTTYPISGRAHNADWIRWGAFSSTLGDWIYTCFPVEADGSFTAELSWSSDDHASYSYSMLQVAAGDCFGGEGWDTSPFIVLGLQ